MSHITILLGKCLALIAYNQLDTATDRSMIQAVYFTCCLGDTIKDTSELENATTCRISQSSFTR